MRTLGGLALALAFLAQGYAIGMYRERSTLAPEVERAYLDGKVEGYDDRFTEDCERGLIECRKHATPPVSKAQQAQRVIGALDASKR